MRRRRSSSSSSSSMKIKRSGVNGPVSTFPIVYSLVSLHALTLQRKLFHIGYRYTDIDLIGRSYMKIKNKAEVRRKILPGEYWSKWVEKRRDLGLCVHDKQVRFNETTERREQQKQRNIFRYWLIERMRECNRYVLSRSITRLITYCPYLHSCYVYIFLDKRSAETRLCAINTTGGKSLKYILKKIYKKRNVI